MLVGGHEEHIGRTLKYYMNNSLSKNLPRDELSIKEPCRYHLVQEELQVSQFGILDSQ